jgi:hypothetical protein
MSFWLGSTTDMQGRYGTIIGQIRQPSSTVPQGSLICRRERSLGHKIRYLQCR